MSYALEALENDDRIGVIVITGAGEKSFAAGADIGQLRQKQPKDALVQECLVYIKKLKTVKRIQLSYKWIRIRMGM